MPIGFLKRLLSFCVPRCSASWRKEEGKASTFCSCKAPQIGSPAANSKAKTRSSVGAVHLRKIRTKACRILVTAMRAEQARTRAPERSSSSEVRPLIQNLVRRNTATTV
jgi:hypothetical protein